jgi:hypothetical protein
MVGISSAPHNLEAFEKEARELLHGLRRMDPVATHRYFLFDPLAGHFEPGLSDARYVVARRHGFRSWPELTRTVLSAKESSRTLPWYSAV